MVSISEQEFICTYLAPLVADYPHAYQLQDDAAHFQFEDGLATIVSSDMLVAGRHFFLDANAFDVAFKAISVNVSDVVSKGGTPKFFSLNLAIPAQCADDDWAEAFVSGLRAAQDHYGVQLLGGDLVGTSGPLTLSISMCGHVAQGGYRSRSQAKGGDLLYVTGKLGLGAMGLQLLLRDQKDPAMLEGFNPTFLSSDDEKEALAHFHCPKVPHRLEPMMIYVNGAMDLSDGLKPDLEKFCVAAKCGAKINLMSIPVLPSVSDLLYSNETVQKIILCGGDDYQILMAVSPKQTSLFESAAKNCGVEISAIGRLSKTSNEVCFETSDGENVPVGSALFHHF